MARCLDYAFARDLPDAISSWKRKHVPNFYHAALLSRVASTTMLECPLRGRFFAVSTTDASNGGGDLPKSLAFGNAQLACFA